MGGYCWLAVLVGVALLLTAGQCDVSCANGHPGEKGAPGRNGWPGQKGERGEPALRGDVQVDAGVLLSLKGEIGSRGLQGVMGPKGYHGDLGAPGSPGNPGRPGPDGKSIGQEQDSPQLARSAFSVIRNDPSYPSYNKKVTYQTTVVNNPGDFNAATGDFTCRIPGVYYFTFHSMARVSMCLAIANDGGNQDRVGFCDYNRNPNNDQVMSGGVVLQLVAGQKVWLVSFRDGQTENDSRNLHEKQIIFSGFLLFSNSV